MSALPRISPKGTPLAATPIAGAEPPAPCSSRSPRHSPKQKTKQLTGASGPAAAVALQGAPPAIPSSPPGASHGAASTNSLYGPYPAFLPPAPDLPKRVNPLQPPPPERRTVALTTEDPHNSNVQRSLRMQQREHGRFHTAWARYYYGAPPEKEGYRAYIRAVLKQQMDDKWNSDRHHMVNKVQESMDAVQQDQDDRKQDQTNHKNHHDFLKTFRDANKSLMEGHWTTRREGKFMEDRYDREQLKYNPINWSCTLK